MLRSRVPGENRRSCFCQGSWIRVSSQDALCGRGSCAPSFGQRGIACLPSLETSVPRDSIQPKESEWKPYCQLFGGVGGGAGRMGYKSRWVHTHVPRFSLLPRVALSALFLKMSPCSRVLLTPVTPIHLRETCRRGKYILQAFQAGGNTGPVVPAAKSSSS